MGMAASQARLLSITARLTNNENTGQAVSYSKQRLADQTQQITNEYNEALNATKLTVLTGFNGAEANYTDISYNLMTGLQMAESTKQYVVTDTKGRILVTNEIADAYEKSRGNYNAFLGALKIDEGKDKGKSYSQADITVNKNSTDEDAKLKTMQQIHEAWDKYFDTVGINFGDEEHEIVEIGNGEHGFSFKWTETVNPDTGKYAIGDGYTSYATYAPKRDENGNIVYEQIPVYETDENGEQKLDENGEPVVVEYKNGDIIYTDEIIYEPICYEGTTPESRDLYDYAMAITEAYLRVNPSENEEPFKLEYNIDNVKSAADSDNASALKYYRNIFDKIQACGYFTYTNQPGKIDKNHIYTPDETASNKKLGDSKKTTGVQKNPMKDNYTFEQLLRNGTLKLEYYSSTNKGFKSTTISEDNCIQEVADERAIAKAESKYNQDMADLEQKDNKFDLDLKRLDTEHKALETEYESVKSVVDKNVESSFKIFS